MKNIVWLLYIATDPQIFENYDLLHMLFFYDDFRNPNIDLCSAITEIT